MTWSSKRPLRLAVGVGLVLMASGCRTPAGPAPPQTTTGPIARDHRFSGTVQVQTPTGRRPVRVEIINIDVRGQYATDRVELPFDGTLMVNLQAGEITTVIGGKRESRRQGQIWTVPAGVPMGVTTGQDSASLQAVLVER